MTLTEDNMKKENAGKYYVPNSGSEGVKDTEQELTFALATVTGGAESKGYTCTANLSIDVDSTLRGYLEAGEAMIAFKGDGVTGENIGTSSYGTEQDLKTASTIGQITFKVNSSTKTTAKLTGYIYFKNDAEKQQNTAERQIAGQSLVFKVKVDSFSCSADVE